MRFCGHWQEDELDLKASRTLQRKRNYARSHWLEKENVT